MKIIFLLIFLMSCTINNQDMSNLNDSYDFSGKTSKVFKLSKKLQEISGLAMSTDGRLFAHDDESARISQIDYATGKIVKSFFVGEKTLKKDFEGLAIAQHVFYLVSSDGVLYEFKEGNEGDHVTFKKHTTKLASKNDVEGLCFDPSNNTLLLACKGDPGKGYGGFKTVYSFSLADKKLSKKPIIKLNINDINNMLEKNFSQKLADFFQVSDKGFAPSGIEIHPGNGTFFVLSAKGRLLVEVSQKGDFLGLALLNKKNHPQPEGITFTPEYDLIIADEGGDGKAILSLYPLLNDN